MACWTDNGEKRVCNSADDEVKVWCQSMVAKWQAMLLRKTITWMQCIHEENVDMFTVVFWLTSFAGRLSQMVYTHSVEMTISEACNTLRHSLWFWEWKLGHLYQLGRGGDGTGILNLFPLYTNFSKPPQFKRCGKHHIPTCRKWYGVCVVLLCNLGITSESVHIQNIHIRAGNWEQVSV